MSRVSPVLIVAACLAGGVAGQQKEAPRECRPSAPIAPLVEVPEASGLAVSGRQAGRLWTHNDSGDPVLFALDQKGTVTGRVRVSGASVDDWEALGAGPCAGGSCLYIADIGDNHGTREHITVYRLPEPSPSDAAAAVDAVFHLTYPDRAQDAETLLVGPGGQLFIVTKGESGAVALYRAPQDLRPGSTARLERVGQPLTPVRPAREFRITDGAISPDGQWVALRTTAHLVFYRTSDFLGGAWHEARRVDLAPLRERQGEGVALGPGHAVYLAGEGGGRRQPGTFAWFVCNASN